MIPLAYFIYTDIKYNLFLASAGNHTVPVGMCTEYATVYISELGTRNQIPAGNQETIYGKQVYGKQVTVSWVKDSLRVFLITKPNWGKRSSYITVKGQ